MKALSIRAPWWWFILHAGKDIENRDWPTRFRGRVYIHASKWWKLEDVTEDSETASRCYHAALCDLVTPDVTFRQMRDVGGHIVGSVEIVDCVSHSNSPWFCGEYGLVLRNPIALKTPIPYKGALGLFEVTI
jgi:hypothetical protein